MRTVPVLDKPTVVVAAPATLLYAFSAGPAIAQQRPTASPVATRESARPVISPKKPLPATASAGSPTAPRPPPDALALGGPSFLWMFVALAAVAGIAFLLRYAYARTATDTRQKDVVTTMVVLYLLGLVFTPFLPVQGKDWMVLDFVAIGSSLGAAFFGFLFGLPQTVTRPEAAARDGAPAVPSHALRASTNLESVADQLTKFITGAAFASIAVAAGYIDTFGRLVQGALTPPATAGVLLGDMLLVAYGALGFTISYIVTRTELTISFAQAAQELVSESARDIDAVPVLPDVGPEANDEQKAVAKKIATLSFESLRNEDARLTWARAQTIVENRAKARHAYEVLYASDRTNPDIIIEFATALYNDVGFDDPNYILLLLKRAQALVRPTEAARLCRIAALTAGTNLYISGGYVVAIETINAFLKTGALPSNTMRFYRACGFGQLYRAFKDAELLTEVDDAAITQRVVIDTAITIGFGKEYKKHIVKVAKPPEGSDDDDLQAFAHDHPGYAHDLLGIEPPPYPDPKSSGEPKVVDPLPDGLTPGELAYFSPP